MERIKDELEVLNTIKKKKKTLTKPQNPSNAVGISASDPHKAAFTSKTLNQRPDLTFSAGFQPPHRSPVLRKPPYRSRQPAEISQKMETLSDREIQRSVEKDRQFRPEKSYLVRTDRRTSGGVQGGSRRRVFRPGEEICSGSVRLSNGRASLHLAFFRFSSGKI